MKLVASSTLDGWWRWPIYGLATLVVLAGGFYLLIAAMVGGGMGWGERTSAQTSLLVVAMITTFALASGFALAAVAMAKDRKRDRAIAYIGLALLPVPLLWAGLEKGWL